MELYLNHFPDRLVHTAGYGAEDMWLLWLKLISATTDLLGCTSGVLSPYNLKLTASKPQSIMLDTVTCNQMFKILSKPPPPPYYNQLCCEQQPTLHTTPKSKDLACFLSLFFLSHD
jgi:hypothetical protein